MDGCSETGEGTAWVRIWIMNQIPLYLPSPLVVDLGPAAAWREIRAHVKKNEQSRRLWFQSFLSQNILASCAFIPPLLSVLWDFFCSVFICSSRDSIRGLLGFDLTDPNSLFSGKLLLHSSSPASLCPSCWRTSTVHTLHNQPLKCLFCKWQTHNDKTPTLTCLQISTKLLKFIINQGKDNLIILSVGWGSEGRKYNVKHWKVNQRNKNDLWP